MNAASTVFLARFVCGWWMESPQNSVAMVVCENANFKDAMWSQIVREAQEYKVGFTYERIQEWRYEPNACGIGAVLCFRFRNRFSEDRLRGMHAHRQLAILQGDPSWTGPAQEHLMSFPLEALCLVIKQP